LLLIKGKDDGQILNWGWVFDSLTTARTLSYYKRSPKLAKFWQVFFELKVRQAF